MRKGLPKIAISHSALRFRQQFRQALNQALKHSDASIMSSFILALRSVSKSFVELNVRSHSALIAGIDNISKAIRDSDGYELSWLVQNLHKLSFFAAYRLWRGSARYCSYSLVWFS